MQKKVTKINRDGDESVVTIFYKIDLLIVQDLSQPLSNLVDNLTEGIHKIKCKDCDCFLEYESVEDNLIKYKCLSCNKYYLSKIDEELKQ